MRQIKFRVWCKSRKEMLEIQRHSFKTNKSMPYGWNMQYEFDALMQYTGLKDINSKEIYEGDIVKTKYGIERIEYFDKEARFRITNYNGGSDKISDYIYDGGLEVIGNIYENKDLLRNREEK